jgi:hypothetical protein
MTKRLTFAFALATLASVAACAPRLAGSLGDACTEAFARAHGALLFVRSAP